MWPISFTLSSLYVSLLPLPNGLWSVSLIHWPHRPCSLPPHSIYTWCFIRFRLPSPRLDLIDFISHCLCRKRKVYYNGILNEIYEGVAMDPAGTLRLPGTNNSKSWNHGGGTTWQELCLQMMIIYIATLRTRNQKLARNRGRKIQTLSSHCFRVDASHRLNPTINQKARDPERSSV